MGKDGARYEVTKYLKHVDALGVFQTSRVPFSEQTTDSLQEQVERSNRLKDPGTHSLHLNRHLDKLFEEWKVEREIKVTKVFQVNPL